MLGVIEVSRSWPPLVPREDHVVYSWMVMQLQDCARGFKHCRIDVRRARWDATRRISDVYAPSLST
jgi:hypothetical protein